MAIALRARMTTIDPAQLVHASGGMKTDGFRRSDNIEDRRSAEDVREDQAWMQSLPVKDAARQWAKNMNDLQIAAQWQRATEDALRARR